MKNRVLNLLGLYLVLAALIVLVAIIRIPSIIALPLFMAFFLVYLAYAFGPYIPPIWVKDISQHGKQATAIVLEKQVPNEQAGRGPDKWFDLPVQVKPADEREFPARMKCRQSQLAGIKPGGEVPVRYDSEKKKRVLLMI